MPANTPQNINWEELIPFFQQVFGNIMDKPREDPLANLTPFMVSPTRGYMTFPMGGGVAGALPTVPATFPVDTINNTPSNLPGAAYGKMATSPNSLQQNEVFTVNSQMPFSDPINGNKLLQPTAFHRMQDGGPIDRQLARWKRRMERLESKGKTDTKRYQRLKEKYEQGVQMTNMYNQGYKFGHVNPDGTFAVTDPYGNSQQYAANEKGLSAFGTNTGNFAQDLAATVLPFLAPGVGSAMAGVNSAFGSGPANSSGLPQFNPQSFGGGFNPYGGAFGGFGGDGGFDVQSMLAPLMGFGAMGGSGMGMTLPGLGGILSQLFGMFGGGEEQDGSAPSAQAAGTTKQPRRQMGGGGIPGQQNNPGFNTGSPIGLGGPMGDPWVDNAGPIQRKLDRWNRRLERLERKGKTDTGRYQRLKTKYDTTLDQFNQHNNPQQQQPQIGQGMNPFGGSGGGFDIGSMLAPLMGFGAMGMGMPGMGGPMGGLGEMISALAQLFNMEAPDLYTDQDNDMADDLSGVGNATGQTPFGSSFGSPFNPTAPGGGLRQPVMANQNVPIKKKGGDVSRKIRKLMKEGKPQDQAVAIALSMKRRNKLKKGGKIKKYQHGGPVTPLVPIQTEKGEMLILPNMHIVDVNARKKHDHMDDDFATDLAPESSYVLSNDKDIKMSRDYAEDILMGFKREKYKESSQAQVPEEIGFDVLWKKNERKDLTPAEIGRRIKKKFPIIDKTEDHEFSDVFTEHTNQKNLEARVPWLQLLVGFNEEERMETIPTFKHGGNIKQYNDGGKLDRWISFGAQLLPLLLSNRGNQGGNQGGGGGNGTNQTAQNLILGALPLDQLGRNRNLAARDAAYRQAISDYGQLGQNLNQLALGTAGVGLMTDLAQETKLPRYNFNAARRRLQNFDYRTPRSFVDALSTPNYDSRAILQELGGRRGGVTLAQLASQQLRERNKAMVDMYGNEKNMELGILQGLNNLDIREQSGNIPLELQEVAARNAQRQSIGGRFTGLFDRMGQIQSQLLPQMTGFQFGRANLQGQAMMHAAQGMTNAGATIGSFGQSGTANNNPAFDSRIPLGYTNNDPYVPNLPDFGSIQAGNVLDGYQGGLGQATPGQTLNQPTQSDLSILSGYTGGLTLGNQCYNALTGKYGPC